MGRLGFDTLLKISPWDIERPRHNALGLFRRKFTKVSDFRSAVKQLYKNIPIPCDHELRRTKTREKYDRSRSADQMGQGEVVQGQGESPPVEMRLDRYQGVA